jgi:hypothetical protein
MRISGAGLATLALALATGPGVLAQSEGRNPQRGNPDRNPANQGEAKVIRGVIAGVTVEGETVLDTRTNRAATAEMSFLTVVGSERTGDREGDAADRNRDREERSGREDQASGDRQRHNLYILWLTPRTEIRRAGGRPNEGDRDASNNNPRNQDSRPGAGRTGNAEPLNFESLELGDRVEVRFLERNPAGENNATVNRRHGRHRTYYGDARTITILSEPGRGDRDRDRDSDRPQQSDRPQNPQQKDRDQ